MPSNLAAARRPATSSGRPRAVVSAPSIPAPTDDKDINELIALSFASGAISLIEEPNAETVAELNAKAAVVQKKTKSRTPRIIRLIDSRDAVITAYWAASVLTDHTRALDWCERNGISTKAQGVGVNTAGGFLAPTETERAIFSLLPVAGTFRAESDVRTMSSDNKQIPRRVGGPTAYFVGENAEIAASQASWDNFELHPQKIGAISRASSEFVEDSAVDYGETFIKEVAFAFADLEDRCGFLGDGSSTYGRMKGIVPTLLDGEHNASKVTAATGHDLFTEIDAADLASLMAALPEQYWAASKFFVSGYGAAQSFVRLGAVASGTTMTVNGPRPQLSFAGVPIVLNPKLPGSGSQTGQVMIMFGDLRSAASLGSRRGVEVKSSEHRYLDLDQISFRATERFGITVHDLGNNSVAGPLVGLVGA